MVHFDSTRRPHRAPNRPVQTTFATFIPVKMHSFPRILSTRLRQTRAFHGFKPSESVAWKTSDPYKVNVAWDHHGDLNRVAFLGTDSKGSTVRMAPSKGDHEGVAPMQLVLMGLAGCSMFDMIGIMKKTKQQVKNVNVEVKGQRGDVQPNPWDQIEMTFVVEGTNLDPKKVEMACNLSISKYCGVHASLNTPEIVWNYVIKDT
jgi:putative redox protein